MGKLKSAQPGEESRSLRSLSETQEETDRRSLTRVGRARIIRDIAGKWKDMRCCRRESW